MNFSNERQARVEEMTELRDERLQHKILDGRAAASAVGDVTRASVRQARKRGLAPCLHSLAIGLSPAVEVYVRNQRRVSRETGIEFVEHSYPGDVSHAHLHAQIELFNRDPSVTGIIIQRPVPEHLKIRELQVMVAPDKDVEGMHPASIGNIVYNDLHLGPCTALAAVALLKNTKLHLPGLEVVVIGHSEIVGKPIAFLLMAEGATVTVCHHMTRNLRIHSRQADAVFVAVGQKNLVTGDMIKPGAALIDIGINRVLDADGKSRIVGDADFDSCLEVAGWITPVPGGVGPLTVAMLMRNVMTALERQEQVNGAGRVCE